jgi:methyltransferase
MLVTAEPLTLVSFVGTPQIAAFLLLLQRGAEELYSAHNTRALLLWGGREIGSDYYPMVVTTHLAWIASLAFLISPESSIVWPLIGYYFVLQVVRYWIIASLGRYWTHRIITVESAPLVSRGPYRVLRHPNYAVTITETFVLPLAFGAFALAVIMTALWWVVIAYKIGLEDETLEARRPKKARLAKNVELKPDSAFSS